MLKTKIIQECEGWTRQQIFQALEDVKKHFNSLEKPLCATCPATQERPRTNSSEVSRKELGGIKK